MASEISRDPAHYPPGYLQEYSGGELIATSVVFIVLETAFAIVRHFARRTHHSSIALDDWFIWPALVVNIALCVLAIILVPAAGVGSHFAAVVIYEPAKLVAWAKGIYADVWLWALAVALPKLSILGFYLRFFTSQWERAISYTLMAIITITFIATALVTTFQCSPIAYQWGQFDGSVADGKCINTLAFYRWMSFPNIVTDVIMLVLPQPMIWRLHTTRSQKLGLTVVFLTGSFGLITACLRFRIFFDNDAFKDNTWTSVQLLKWTDIEPGIYFIAACMPSFRPLFVDAWRQGKSVLSSHSQSKTTGSGYSRGSHRQTVTIGGHGGKNNRHGTWPSNASTLRTDLETGDDTGLERPIMMQPPGPQCIVRKQVPSGRIMVTNNVMVQHSANGPDDSPPKI